jgi:hypothetical protein
LDKGARKRGGISANLGEIQFLVFGSGSDFPSGVQLVHVKAKRSASVLKVKRFGFVDKPASHPPLQ